MNSLFLELLAAKKDVRRLRWYLCFICIVVVVLAACLIGDFQEISRLEARNAELQHQVDTKLFSLKVKDEMIKVQAKELAILRQITPSDAPTIRAIHTMEATFYNDYGRTATGNITQHAKTFAVDPRIIPLHSKLFVVLPDGTQLTGYAHDTGGAVKGNIIDIYMNISDKEAFQKGRMRGVTVYVYQ